MNLKKFLSRETQVKIIYLFGSAEPFSLYYLINFCFFYFYSSRTVIVFTINQSSVYISMVLFLLNFPEIAAKVLKNYHLHNFIIKSFNFWKFIKIFVRQVQTHVMFIIMIIIEWKGNNYVSRRKLWECLNHTLYILDPNSLMGKNKFHKHLEKFFGLFYFCTQVICSESNTI